MNEEKTFLDSHPSLKGDIIKPGQYLKNPISSGKNIKIFGTEEIHETQLDKQMIKQLPDGDFIIKLPKNSTQEQMHHFIRGLTKSGSKRKGKIYVTNQDFKIALLDEISPYIMKQKVKEAFEPTKIKSLLMGSPFDEHPKIIQRILKEELGL